MIGNLTLAQVNIKGTNTFGHFQQKTNKKILMRIKNKNPFLFSFAVYKVG